MWSDDDIDALSDDDADYTDDAYDEDDTGETLPCPACGNAVYEDADQCPYCGEWIIPLRGRGGWPPWVRVVGLIVAGALLFGVIGGLIRWAR